MNVSALFNYSSLAASLGLRGFIQGREYRARCPLHQDTNPSFSMNIDKGTWICFKGCGAGEFFRLVQLVLNCSPGEAREWITSNGRSANVENLSKQLGEALNGNEGDPDYLPPNMGWRSRYNALTNVTMPLWFLERGFSWNTISRWDIRYDVALDAIVIPVFWNKELVGTVTRHTRSEYPKYVNSPKLPRAEVLFGDISGVKKQIIVCEGVLDALWFWQNGYEVAGLLGNSLTEGQVQILTQFRYGEVTLALDNDEGGRLGTGRAIDLLLQAGWLLPQIKLMHFPGKPGEAGYRKDANDCDPDQLEQLYASRKDIIRL